MSEKDREWDAINYIDSIKDACGYLQACLQEEPGDGSLLRLALSDIARAQANGKFHLATAANNAQLLQSLTNTGHLPPQAAQKIAHALNLEPATTN